MFYPFDAIKKEYLFVLVKMFTIYMLTTFLLQTSQDGKVNFSVLWFNYNYNKSDLNLFQHFLYTLFYFFFYHCFFFFAFVVF